MSVFNLAQKRSFPPLCAIQKFADWRNCLEETVETSIDSDTDPVTVEIKG
jgi:hypothetical protein